VIWGELLIISEWEALIGGELLISECFYQYDNNMWILSYDKSYKSALMGGEVIMTAKFKLQNSDRK